MRASTFALAVIGCLLSNAAFAHAHLRAETPAANASVQAPTALTLTFSEGLEPGLTGVVLETSDGASVKTGDVSLDSASDKTLVVPVPAKLAPGDHAVEWHALSKDGHLTHGTYQFKVLP
jgi:copper resistance protein C